MFHVLKWKFQGRIKYFNKLCEYIQRKIFYKNLYKLLWKNYHNFYIPLKFDKLFGKYFLNITLNLLLEHFIKFYAQKNNTLLPLNLAVNFLIIHSKCLKRPFIKFNYKLRRTFIILWFFWCRASTRFLYSYITRFIYINSYTTKNCHTKL